MPNIPYGQVGAAGREVSDDIAHLELYAGPHSQVFEDFPFAAETTIAAFSVVGLSGGNLVLATEDKTVQAIGVTMAPIASGVGETGTCPIARDGCFNPDALTWDASYDDLPKKKAAFRDAPTPTQITVQETVG